MSEADVQHANAVLMAGRPADALRSIGTHLAQHPDDASALCLASDALRMLGRGPEALDAAVNAVRLAPEEARGWTCLAFAQREVHDLASAVASATHAVELAHSNWAAHTNLSLIAGEQNPTGPLALQAAQEAIRLAPNSSEAHQSVGVALLRLKQPKKAMDSFATALRLDPQNELARHNMAIASLRTGNPARAVVDLASLTAQAPDDALAYGNLRVAIDRTLGQIHSAVFAGAFASVQILRVVRTSVPTDGPAQLILGGIALATLGAIAYLIVRTGRTLGASLGPLFRFVVARDRLIAAWAVVDALGLLPLIISPFLPPELWPVSYGSGWLFVFTGVIIRVIRARMIRGEARKR